MLLSYSCGGRPVSYAMPLPVKVTCFFEPVVLDKGTFMERWRAYDGGDSETQETFSSGRQITPDLMAAVRSTALPALHLGLATDIDTATTATACGTFKTGTMAADGITPLVIGTMMRLEADAGNNRFRITVRSKNKIVALGLVDAIKTVLM